MENELHPHWDFSNGEMNLECSFEESKKLVEKVTNWRRHFNFLQGSIDNFNIKLEGQYIKGDGNSYKEYALDINYKDDSPYQIQIASHKYNVKEKEGEELRSLYFNAEEIANNNKREKFASVQKEISDLIKE